MMNLFIDLLSWEFSSTAINTKEFIKNIWYTWLTCYDILLWKWQLYRVNGFCLKSDIKLGTIGSDLGDFYSIIKETWVIENLKLVWITTSPLSYLCSIMPRLHLRKTYLWVCRVHSLIIFYCLFCKKKLLKKYWSKRNDAKKMGEKIS